MKGNQMHKDMEKHRQIWAKVAKDNGWYQEPFYVQLWINENNEVTDSVSTRHLTQDIIVQETRYCEICEDNEASPESDTCANCELMESN